MNAVDSSSSDYFTADETAPPAVALPSPAATPPRAAASAAELAGSAPAAASSSRSLASLMSRVAVEWPRHGKRQSARRQSSRRSAPAEQNEDSDGASSCSELGFVPSGSEQASSSDDDSSSSSWADRPARRQAAREAVPPLSAVKEVREPPGTAEAAARFVQRSHRAGRKLAHEEREIERETEEAVVAALGVAASKTAAARARLLGAPVAAAAPVPTAVAAAAPPAAIGIIKVQAQAVHRGRRQRPSVSSSLTFEEATAPRPYVLVACAYPGTPFELRGVSREASQVEACAGLVARLNNPSLDEVRAQLPTCRGLHLLCHGDAPLHGECVPLLGSGGRDLQAVSIDALVALLQPHAAAGTLQHVYLGGCCTYELGHALCEHAGVPCVVCYRGRVHRSSKPSGSSLMIAPRRVVDGAAALFGTELVLAETEAGLLDNQLKGRVQKYCFADPEGDEVHRCAPGPVCALTACPRAQCPWRGRLCPPVGLAAVSPQRWRGRVATAEPVMLVAEGWPEQNAGQSAAARAVTAGAASPGTVAKERSGSGAAARTGGSPKGADG